MIETCLVIMLVGLIFAGILQVSRISAAHEILQYAASCGARAQAVGFNQWMVAKCIKAGSIANAGRMITPAFDNQTPLRGMVPNRTPGSLWSAVVGMTPQSGQFNIERARLPDFLDSDNRLRAENILNYEYWDDGSPNAVGFGVRLDGAYAGTQPSPDTRVQVTTEQEYPLQVPAHRAFYASDSLSLSGKFEMESHYPLYLNDMLW